MSDMEKNINEEEVDELGDIVYTLTDEEEVDELGDIVYTLTDEETGEEIDFQLIARATIDDVLYFALVPADDEDCEEYVILRVTEDGDDLILESIDDDDEFEKAEDYFNDLLFGEIDYDE